MHDCPDCYSACYCGGDIDDMLMEGAAEEQACTHCPDYLVHADDDDCHGCGHCTPCVEASMSYADEMEQATRPRGVNHDHD